MTEVKTKTWNRPLLWVAALFLLGTVLRFFELDLRPVHHDESLHGTYAKYVMEGQPYRYDPMLHGPLLYTVTAWLFSLFGMSTFILRSLNAALGSLFVLTPLLFRRYLSNNAIIAATAFLSLSPTLIYWSRFAHHDYLVLAAYVLLAAAVFLVPNRGGIVLALASFALQYTIKANVFVFAALLAGYLVFDLGVGLLRKQPSLAGRLAKHLLANWPEFLLGIAVAVLIFCALYSGNFRYSEGILDGLYRKVFPYWIKQHAEQRLDGPFTFHLLVLFLYELPLLIAGIAAVFLTVSEFSRALKALVIAFTLILLGISISVPEASFLKEGFLKQDLKLTGWFDLWACGTVAVLAFLIPLHHRLRNEPGLAFFGYMALSTLWIYGFLGEKVPWLTIYPTVSLFIYCVIRFDRSQKALEFLRGESRLVKQFRFTATAVLAAAIICVAELLLRGDDEPLPYHTLAVIGWSAAATAIMTALELNGPGTKVRNGIFLLVLGALLTANSTIITNYTAAGAPSELLSQVHTTKEMHQIFLSMHDEMTNPLHPDDIDALISGAAVWPATWYLVNLPGFHFQAPESDYPSMNYFVVDEGTPNLPKDYDSTLVPLQSWWVPNYGILRLRDLFGYYFDHTPWNETGSLNVRFLRTSYGINTENEPSSTEE